MNMISIITILIVLFVLYSLKKGINTKYTSTSKPIFDEDDYIKKINDKVIKVRGPIFNDVKLLCQEFCGQFNTENFLIIINLTRVDAQTNLITFPYDIHLKYFVYLIQFLQTRKTVQYTSQVKGWSSIRPTDPWFQDLENPQKMMFFLADEHGTDCIYASTEGQLTYKLIIDFEKSKELVQYYAIKYEAFTENLEYYSFGKGILIT